MALLDAARELIVKNGYSATSINDICDKAGYTKGTFFYYFENKEDIAKNLLRRQQEMIANLAQAPFMQAQDPLQRFAGYIDFISGIYRDPIKDSCIIGFLSEELADSHPRIRRLCKEAFADWSASIRSMLEEARDAKLFAAGIDVGGLAELFLAVFEGSVILARAQQSVEPITRNLRMYQDYVLSSANRRRKP